MKPGPIRTPGGERKWRVVFKLDAEYEEVSAKELVVKHALARLR
jgi:hypothetical protein